MAVDLGTSLVGGRFVSGGGLEAGANRAFGADPFAAHLLAGDVSLTEHPVGDLFVPAEKVGELFHSIEKVFLQRGRWLFIVC